MQMNLHELATMMIRRLLWVAIASSAVVTCGSVDQPARTAPAPVTLLVLHSPRDAADALPPAPAAACRSAPAATAPGC